MQITRAAEYAVRCVLYLALEGKGRTVPRREIAGAMRLPEQFLAKVAQRLARAGILGISQGARGGFVLRQEPRRVTLLQVVEAVDGEIQLNLCVTRPESCFRNPTCPVNRTWERLRSRLRGALAKVNFAALAKAEACGAGSPPATSKKKR